MSTAAVLAVLELAPPEWSSGLRIVAVALAERVDAAGQAWPSVEDIARRSGLRWRHVTRHLHTLEAAGWVTITHRAAGSGRSATNLYAWHPVALPTLATVTPIDRAGVSPTTGEGVAHDRGEGVAHDRGRVSPTTGTEGVAHDRGTVSEPSVRTDREPSLTQARHSPSPLSTGGDNLDTDDNPRECDHGHLSRHAWCRPCREAWPERINGDPIRGQVRIGG